MKSLASYLFTSAACLFAAGSMLAQGVVPAVSLGDPIPAYQADPNVVLVNGSSCKSCAPKINVQPCSEPAKNCGSGCKETIVSVACPSDCKPAPCCARVAPKVSPCKACDVPKLFHRIPAAAACSTCSTPTPAPCKTCSTPAPAPATPCPAPAPCITCAPKTLIHHHAPAACATCPAPAPAPSKTCAAPAVAPCATCPAPAPCNACETKKLFHHSAPAQAACKPCSAPVAPCKVETKPCDYGCAKPAPASCATCDPCKAADPCGKVHVFRVQHCSILDGLIMNVFSVHGHQPPPAVPCASCTASHAAPVVIPTAQAIPTQAPVMVPQAISYQNPNQQPAAVPAALAPYVPQSQFSTAAPAVVPETYGNK